MHCLLKGTPLRVHGCRQRRNASASYFSLHRVRVWRGTTALQADHGNILTRMKPFSDRASQHDSKLRGTLKAARSEKHKPSGRSSLPEAPEARAPSKHWPCPQRRGRSRCPPPPQSPWTSERRRHLRRSPRPALESAAHRASGTRQRRCSRSYRRTTHNTQHTTHNSQREAQSAVQVKEAPEAHVRPPKTHQSPSDAHRSASGVE